MSEHLRSKVFNHDAVGDLLLFKPSLFIKKSISVLVHHISNIICIKYRPNMFLIYVNINQKIYNQPTINRYKYFNSDIKI